MLKGVSGERNFFLKMNASFELNHDRLASDPRFATIASSLSAQSRIDSQDSFNRYCRKACLLWSQHFSNEPVGTTTLFPELLDRINRRAAKMFEAGLVEETAGLFQKYGANAWPLASLGYKQAVQLLRGEITREQALGAAQQAHRNYAKRQMTWFRREPEVIWLRGFGDEVEIQEQVIASIAKFK